MKYILLLLIIGLKVLLTKLFGISLILLSFLIKGKLLTHNSWNRTDWNTYFVNISNSFVLKWGIGIYLTSSVLATLIIYTLFYLFGFQYPISYSIILFIICAVLTWLKYHKKEEIKITEKLSLIRQTTKEELETTDIK